MNGFGNTTVRIVLETMQTRIFDMHYIATLHGINDAAFPILGERRARTSFG